MTLLVPLVLFGWIPMVLLLFANLPPRRAVVVAFVAGWLLLPNASYEFSGIPNYTKMTAASLSVLLSTLIFDPNRLTAFRPRWFDLPMLTWCLCPMATSVLNGLGVYDGFSTSLNQTVSWGLPYLIGRMYLGDGVGVHELALAILIGGLIYILPCLYEIRMSPQLHRTFYGSGTWGGTRFGGYRPQVFMKNGLELGMWMTAVSVVGYGLWTGGALKRLWDIPFGGWLALLLFVTVLCKSTGALALMIVGIAALWATDRAGFSLPIWILLLISPCYMAARATNIWSGNIVVELTERWVDSTRAESYAFRLKHENLLVEKALQQPYFGWGGWGRNRVFDEKGRDISITDGRWVITLGKNGVVGLTALTTAMLLPFAMLLVRYPIRLWKTPELAPAAALGVLLALYMTDNLSNAMHNPIYMLAAGGLAGFAACRTPSDDPSAFSPSASQGSERSAVDDCDPEACWALALEHASQARSLADQNPFEAKAEWLQALDLWEQCATHFPDSSELCKQRLDTFNNLAWFLTTTSEPAIQDPGLAVQLSEAAVTEAPDCGTYWNTLGAAHYRVGDWETAIAALEQALERGSGGTAYDHFYLAMAHWRQGNPHLAGTWFHRAIEFLNKQTSIESELQSLRAEAAHLMKEQPVRPSTT